MRRWRRAWAEGGLEALKSKGPVSAERLSPTQWARLEAELRWGPLAHGFAHDQRWTLVRVKTLIGRLIHVGYTIQGTWKREQCPIAPDRARPAPCPAARRAGRRRCRGSGLRQDYHCTTLSID